MEPVEPGALVDCPSVHAYTRLRTESSVYQRPMKTELTASQSDGYRENGFLVIDDFLTAGELEQWRSAVGEAAAAKGP